jgi:hypothetical protein
MDWVFKLNELIFLLKGLISAAVRISYLTNMLVGVEQDCILFQVMTL